MIVDTYFSLDESSFSTFKLHNNWHSFIISHDFYSFQSFNLLERVESFVMGYLFISSPFVKNLTILGRLGWNE
jgi:hypothetical protein